MKLAIAKHIRISLVIILLLAFGLRIYRLDNQSLWWDELFTVASSAMTVPELLANLFDDRVHLPFYYLLMLGWSQIGRSAFILRYSSAVVGVLSVPLMYQTGRLLAGKKVGLVAATLLAISPFHIWYSQEVRMYTFLTFTALAANYYILSLLRKEGGRIRGWVGYAIAMTLTLYSHYLAAFVLIAHYVFFSLHYRYDKERFRNWLVSASFAVTAFAAWFLAVFFVRSFTEASISWISPVHWFEPVLTLLAFAVGRTIDPERLVFYLAFFAYLLPALTSLSLLRRTNTKVTFNQLAARLLWLWLVVPLVLVTLISLDWSIPNQRFIYMDRYIISLLPAFILLTSWGVVNFSQEGWAKQWLMPVFCALILLPTIVSLRNLYFDPAYGREDWREAVAHMATHKQTGDLLLLSRGQILPLAYYEVAQLPRIILPSDFMEAGTGEEFALDEMIASEIGGTVRRVWLLRSFDNADTHGFPQTRNQAVLFAPLNPYEAWVDENYSQTGKWNFPGIRLRLYDLQE